MKCQQYVGVAACLQVASIYMDLRPEEAQHIHSSMCGGSDALPGPKPPPRGGPSPGGPPPDGGGASGGSAQPRAQENTPSNGQSGMQPLSISQTAHSGSRAVEAESHVGPHGLEWDVEQGLAGILPWTSRPPSGRNGRQLSSISESESSDCRNQTLSDLQVLQCAIGRYPDIHICIFTLLTATILY